MCIEIVIFSFNHPYVFAFFNDYKNSLKKIVILQLNDVNTMKNYFFLLFAVIFIGNFKVAGSNDSIILNGIYTGKALIIQNPLKDSLFSVQKINLNGKATMTDVRSSAFELNFSVEGIKENDTVEIIIFYDQTIGKPTIFNPEVLKPSNDFRFISAECDRKKMTINWTVSASNLTEPFEVEQYRWDKWMTIQLVNPQEVKSYPKFSASFVPHSGRNLFRVKYIDAEGTIFYSNDIKYTSKGKEVMLLSDKVKNTIDFSEETMYQLYDEHGALLLDGWGKTIDIELLDKGKYYLNYDNKTVVVTKR